MDPRGHDDVSVSDGSPSSLDFGDNFEVQRGCRQFVHSVPQLVVSQAVGAFLFFPKTAFIQCRISLMVAMSFLRNPSTRAAESLKDDSKVAHPSRFNYLRVKYSFLRFLVRHKAARHSFVFPVRFALPRRDLLFVGLIVHHLYSGNIG